MIGNWRALHNEKLNKFYSPPNIFRMISKNKDEMGRAYSTYEL